MKIMLWGGRSKARIIIEMISESIYSNSKIIGIFDKTIDKIPFKTRIQLYSDNLGFDFMYFEIAIILAIVPPLNPPLTPFT